MEEFLGVLYCGGRGTRLGEITRYISKSFVPIYDRPVFRFGLDLLEKSAYINEIVILTNDDNNEKLRQVGYLTIVQDDNVVFDMFSGWEYIKKATGTCKHGVLMPGDNISDINVDELIDLFLKRKVDLVFSLFKIMDQQKLSQMGCYHPQEEKFYYKHPNPPTSFGVAAPYIVRNSLKVESGDNILNHHNSAYCEHSGYWFDIGDCESIIEASLFMMNMITKEKESVNR
jgi:dTDP-glucose pyrophosphorylase